MGARIAKGSSLTAAALAMALAGCAGTTPPPDPALPPCDLICHLLRIFDPDVAAPPPPVAPAPPAPHVRTKDHVPARDVLARGRKVRPAAARLRPGLPPVPPQEQTTLVPRTPEAAIPDPAPPVTPMQQTMDGSIAIAPPWFEPWPARR